MDTIAEISYSGLGKRGEPTVLNVSREKLESTYAQLHAKIAAAEASGDGPVYARGVYTLGQLICAEIDAMGGDETDFRYSMQEWADNTDMTMHARGVPAVLETLATGGEIAYGSDTLDNAGVTHANRDDWHADSRSIPTARSVADYVGSRGEKYILTTTTSGGIRNSEHSPSRVITKWRGLGGNMTVPSIR